MEEDLHDSVDTLYYIAPGVEWELNLWSGQHPFLKYYGRNIFDATTYG